MLSLSWQLHLAVRAITLEKDMDKQELGVKLKTFRHGEGVEPGANTVLKIWHGPFILGPGAGKPELSQPVEM